MRIGMDIREASRRPTGPGIYALELAKHLLRAAGEDEHVFFHDTEVPERLTGSGARIRVLRSRWGGRRLRRAWYEQFALARAVHAERLDLFFGPAFTVPLLRSCPTVLAVHDVLPFLMPGEFSWRQRVWHESLVRWNARRVEAIVTVSESSRRDIHRVLDVPLDRVHTIPNGVDPSFHPALNDSILPPLRARLGIDREYLLYPGGLLRRKNVMRLLEAFLDLRRAKRIPHLLVLTGDLDASKDRAFIEEIRALLNERNAWPFVLFTGYVEREEMASLYRGAAVVLYPSLYEGFGMPVLEAMASGAPVLTSNRSSLPEVAGGSALLVSPESVDEIRNGIVRLLEDEALRRALVERGLARARSFRWDEAAAALRSVFGTVTGEPGAATAVA